MPYKSIRELPPAVKDALPAEAQHQFLRVVNSVLAKGGSEEAAFKQAWAVVKKRFRKEGDKWVKMDDTQYLVPFADRGDGWFLYFPVGTLYHHRRKVDFTETDGQEMAANFAASVVDYDLPINVLHRDDLGVFGYVADMRYQDGEVQFQPQWRPEKEQEIKDKGYRYFSPEIVFEAYQTLDGTDYNNVALGGAITPRPRLGRQTALFSDGEWLEMDDDESLKEAVAKLSEEVAAIVSNFAEPFKTEDGMKFKRSAYLIVGDPDTPTTWKARVEETPGKITAAQLGRAAAALGPKGFMGNPLKGVSSEQVASAKRKLVALYRKAGVEKEKIPKYLFEEENSMELNEEALAEGLFSRLWERISKKAEEEKPEPEPVDFSEQLAELREEFDAKLAEKDEAITALSAEKEGAVARLAEFEAQSAQAEQERKLAQFSDVAKELGIPGDGADEFASALMAFHDADGSEEKAQYNLLLATMKALGNQQEMAALFSEKGTGVQDVSVEDRFEILVKARMEQFGEGRGVAANAVLEANPELYKAAQSSS